MSDEPLPAEAADRQPAHSDPHASLGGWWKVALLLVVAACLAAAVRFLPVERLWGDFLEKTRALGPWGPLALGTAYVVATVLMVPGVILTLGAGFLFGFWTGLLTVSLGSVAGALAAFLIGRHFLRRQVEQCAEQFPKFAPIDQAIEQAGFKIVLLTRLSPLFPFNALNYLLSITKVRTRDYFLASWIGMLPGTVMYVYLGAAAKSLAAIVQGEVDGGVAEKAFLAVGLVVTIGVTWYVTRLARNAVANYLPDDPP